MSLHSSSSVDSPADSGVISGKPLGYYSNSRDELLALVPASANHVLEIGCGEGRLGGRLKATRPSNNLEVVGVELCESAASVARSCLDEVIVADVEKLDLEYAGHFDCVIFADVLEHLRDPWRTLCAVSQYLRPDGVVVASIPNIQQWRVIVGLLRGSFDYADDGIMDSTHLRFFTRKTVLKLFSTTGYDVQFIRPYFATRRSRMVNSLTGGSLAGLLAFQYHVVACRATR